MGWLPKFVYVQLILQELVSTNMAHVELMVSMEEEIQALMEVHTFVKYSNVITQNWAILSYYQKLIAFLKSLLLM